MSIRYIFGLPGSGKTELIMNELTAKINGASDGGRTALLYIVPEQYSLQSEKNLVARLRGMAVTRAQVLSFRRLAFHVFAETGAPEGRFIEDMGKNMLLRKLVQERSGELVFFGKAADKPGFTDSLSSLITELYRYGVDAEGFKAKLEFLSADSPVYGKLSELSGLYEGYRDYISGRYISADDTLDLLARRLDASELLRGAEVWIDGFHSFTPQELRVIAAMLPRAYRVTVSVTSDESGVSFGGLKPADFFFETKHTVNKLSALAEACATVVEPPVFLSRPLHRYARFPELDFLARHYFLNKTSCFRTEAASSERIKIIHASDKYAELDAVARELLRLVRDGGYRYRETAVLTGALGLYASAIADVFAQYEIPCFIDVKNDILAHPLTELIRAAVDIAARNWQYEGVFRFLKTRLTGIAPDAVDILENYVLAYGIKGYKWGMNEWRYGFADGTYDKEMLHGLKNRVTGMLRPLTEGLKSGGELTVRAFSERIFAMLYQLDVPAALDAWAAELNAAGELEAARAHGQIWAKVCSVFDKMVEILGDERVNAREYARILDAGLSAADMGIIPPSVEQVTVGDIARSRLPEIKALFVVGANEGLLPKPREETGILTDDERAALAAAGLELSPGKARRALEEQLMIYCGIAKPTDFLMISYCFGDLDGKTLRRSGVAERIKKMFPDVPDQSAAAAEAASPKPALARLGPVVRAYLAGERITDGERDVLGWFLGHPEYSGIVYRMEEVYRGAHGRERLGKSAADRLYPNEIITSVSRLERYAQCPFAYFMDYSLNAREREIYQVRPLDTGTLFHAVLEDFSRELQKEGLNWRDVAADDIAELVDAAVERLGAKAGNEVFLSSAKYRYMLGRVKRMAARSVWALAEHIKSGSFEPYMSELEFRADGPLTAISININEKQRFILTGKIDRVDIMDANGNRYVKILDYKSGSKKFDEADVYFGMQLQLILYLDAFLKLGNKLFRGAETKLLPGGVFYFNINDPIPECADEPGDAELERMMLEAFKLSGLAVSEREVIEGLDANISKSSAIIPVRLDKDGNVKGGGAVEPEDFDRLREAVLGKVKELGREMTGGNINARPFRKGTFTGCDFCVHGAACGFSALELDAALKYNDVRKV